MGATVIRTSGSEGAIVEVRACAIGFLQVFSPPGALPAPKRVWCFPAGRYVRRRGGGGSPPGALSAPKGEWPYTEATPSGAAPTSPPEGVFRHKRRMELVELSGRITGRLGYTRRPEPTPSEGRQRWHNDALSSPQPPPPALFLRDDCGPPGLLGMGTAAASAGAAGPSQELRAGWSSGRTEAGVHRGERTTHLRERADDRDSEPDYLLRPTRHGPGNFCNSGKGSFYLTINA